MPADRVPAVQAGDISITFERALSEYQSLGPKVLSRDPWVMSFDNFLSDEEVEAVVKHGEGRFERSTASGGRKDDEFIPLKSDIRTSWTTWCDTSACLEDPIVKRIYNRVSNVTRVPADNFEYMQLLRYLPCPHDGHPDCQFYRRHRYYPRACHDAAGPSRLHLLPLPLRRRGGRRHKIRRWVHRPATQEQSSFLARDEGRGAFRFG